MYSSSGALHPEEITAELPFNFGASLRRISPKYRVSQSQQRYRSRTKSAADSEAVR